MAETRCHHGATNLGDDYVWRRCFMSLKTHATLDFIGNVGNHLNGVAQVLSAALARYHGRIDLTGGYVGRLTEVDVEKALIVADI